MTYGGRDAPQTSAFLSCHVHSFQSILVHNHFVHSASTKRQNRVTLSFIDSPLPPLPCRAPPPREPFHLLARLQQQAARGDGQRHLAPVPLPNVKAREPSPAMDGKEVEVVVIPREHHPHPLMATQVATGGGQQMRGIGHEGDKGCAGEPKADGDHLCGHLQRRHKVGSPPVHHAAPVREGGWHHSLPNHATHHSCLLGGHNATMLQCYNPAGLHGCLTSCAPSPIGQK